MKGTGSFVRECKTKSSEHDERNKEHNDNKQENHFANFHDLESLFLLFCLIRKKSRKAQKVNVNLIFFELNNLNNFFCSIKCGK